MATTRRSRPKRWLHANQNLFAINYYLGAGWSCYYNSLDFIYPGSAVAEEDLERFLSGVLSLAGAVWANQPDRTVRVASLGQLILKVTSNEPIPWQWIHGYLLGAIWWTRSGHVMGYKTTYRNHINGVRIVVELILPMAAAAAAAA